MKKSPFQLKEGWQTWLFLFVLFVVCLGFFVARSGNGRRFTRHTPLEVRYFSGVLDEHHDHALERLLIFGYGVRRIEKTLVCNPDELAVEMIPRTWWTIPLGKDVVCYINAGRDGFIPTRIISLERVFQ